MNNKVLLKLKAETKNTTMYGLFTITLAYTFGATRRLTSKTSKFQESCFSSFQNASNKWFILNDPLLTNLLRHYFFNDKCTNILFRRIK